MIRVGTKMYDYLMIRNATVQDIKSLAELYAEFHNFHASYLPDRLRKISVQPVLYEAADLYQKLRSIIESEKSEIVVAKAGEQIVGLAEIYIQQDNANTLTVPYCYGLLQSLVVTSEHRRQGVGALLVKAIEQWAKKKGAHEIRLDLWEFGEGPLPFYEQMGYRTLKRTMTHQITEGSSE